MRGAGEPLRRFSRGRAAEGGIRVWRSVASRLVMIASAMQAACFCRAGLSTQKGANRRPPSGNQAVLSGAGSDVGFAGVGLAPSALLCCLFLALAGIVEDTLRRYRRVLQAEWRSRRRVCLDKKTACENERDPTAPSNRTGR